MKTKQKRMTTGRPYGVVTRVDKNGLLLGKTIYQNAKDPEDPNYYIARVNKEGRILDFEIFDLKPYLESISKEIGKPILLENDNLDGKTPIPPIPDGKLHFIYFQKTKDPKYFPESSRFRDYQMVFRIYYPSCMELKFGNFK